MELLRELISLVVKKESLKKNTTPVASNSDASTFAGRPVVPSAPTNVQEAESHIDAWTEQLHADHDAAKPAPRYATLLLND